MYYLGIDLGGTNIACGLVDENGHIVFKDSVETKAQRDYKEIIADMAKLALKICEKAQIGLDKVKGVGIGSPGTIDSKNGKVVYTNNLNFKDVPVRTELQKYIDLPVYISNDANCAALGETVTGAAKGYKNVILITLGTGVGGGVIIDGKIYEGNYSAGAELGHSVIVVDGERCTCGRKGCWECYSSATALIRQTKKAISENKESIMLAAVDGDIEKVNGRTAFDASRKGDATAVKVVENYIKYLGEGITNLNNIFRSEIIIVGGGICNEGDYLLNPVREYVNKNSYAGDLVAATPIVKALLGNDAGIIGAAMLAK